MANIVFLDDGGEGAQNLNNWLITGTVTSDTGQFHSGTRAIKCDSTASNINAYVQKNAILADAGRRISFWMYFSALPATSPHILTVLTTGGATVISVDLNSTGKIGLENAATNFNGTTTLAINTWYHVTFDYTITSTTVNSFRLYLGTSSTPEVTQTNITIATTVGTDLRIGQVQVPGASKQLWLDDIYVDDGTTLDNPGDIRCTSKRPVGTSEGTGFNDWDTVIGTSRATGSRYLNMGEVPGSDTNGWSHLGTSQVYEKYLIESASAGDLNISGYTLVGWMAWVRTKTATAVSTASLTDNDVDTVISTKTTYTNSTHATTSSTYPSGRFGMRSTGTATDTFMTEVGVIAAYFFTSGSTTNQALSVTSSSALLFIRQAGKLPSVTSTSTRAFGPTLIGKLSSVTSSGILARVLQVGKNWPSLHVDGITAVLTRQANKSPFASSTSTASRDPFVVGKVPSSISTALVSFGPKAIARALSQTSSAVLSALKQVAHAIGPLHSDTFLLLGKQATKTEAASSASSAASIKQATKAPGVSASNTAIINKLVSKLPSVTSSGVATLIASTAHVFTQALSYTSSSARALLKLAAKLPSASSTSTSSTSRSASKSATATATSSASRVSTAGKSLTATSSSALTRVIAFTQSVRQATSSSVLALSKNLTQSARSLSSSASSSLIAARTKLLALSASAGSAASALRMAGKNISSTSVFSASIPRAISITRALTSNAQLALQAGSHSIQNLTLAVTSVAGNALSRFVGRTGPVYTSSAATSQSHAMTHPLSLTSTASAVMSRARSVVAALAASATSSASALRSVLATRSQDATGSASSVLAVAVTRSAVSATNAVITRALAITRTLSASGTAALLRARASYLNLLASSTGTATRRNSVLTTRAASSFSSSSLAKNINKILSAISDAILALNTGSTLTFNQILSVTATGLGSLRKGAASARVAASTGLGSVGRAVGVLRARTASSTAVVSRGVSLVSSAVSTGTSGITFGQVFAQLLAAVSSGVGSVVRSAGVHLGASSVGGMSLLRGVGKGISFLGHAILDLVTRRLFRPGKPIWISTGAVSIKELDTGDVNIMSKSTGDVSIKERDYAEL